MPTQPENPSIYFFTLKGLFLVNRNIEFWNIVPVFCLFSQSSIYILSPTYCRLCQSSSYFAKLVSIFGQLRFGLFCQYPIWILLIWCKYLVRLWFFGQPSTYFQTFLPLIFVLCILPQVAWWIRTFFADFSKCYLTVANSAIKSSTTQSQT